MPRYLVCSEPSEAEHVTYYTIRGLKPNNETMSVPASPETDHGFILDLSFLDPGAYTVKANACNEWLCSLDSLPFAFTVPERPSPPAGLRLR